MNGENGTLKIPTVGRVVHFHSTLLAGETEIKEIKAAIVTKVSDTGAVCLSILTGEADYPVHVAKEVSHKSQVAADAPCWDWPPIG